MPAKGWRKHEDGSFAPQGDALVQKDADLVSIESLLFPKSTINRLAKQVLGGGDDLESAESELANMSLAKEGLTVIQRSSVVFVSHLYHYARQISKDANRKGVSDEDVMEALKMIDFEQFLPVMQEERINFKTRKQRKKAKKDSNDTIDEEDIDNEEEDDTEAAPKGMKKLKIKTGSSIKAVATGTEDADKTDETMSDKDDEEEEDLHEEEPEEEEEEDEEVALKPTQQLEQEHRELAGESANEVSENEKEEEEEEEEE